MYNTLSAKRNQPKERSQLSAVFRQVFQVFPQIHLLKHLMRSIEVSFRSQASEHAIAILSGTYFLAMATALFPLAKQRRLHAAITDGSPVRIDSSYRRRSIINRVREYKLRLKLQTRRRLSIICSARARELSVEFFDTLLDSSLDTGYNTSEWFIRSVILYVHFYYLALFFGEYVGFFHKACANCSLGMAVASVRNVYVPI